MPNEKYREKLNSPWWRAYRREVLRLFGEKCNRCGISNPRIPLQVHHKRYIKGLEPWQYRNPRDIEVLCIYCHRREHGIKGDQGHTAPLKGTAEIIKGMPCITTQS